MVHFIQDNTLVLLSMLDRCMKLASSYVHSNCTKFYVSLGYCLTQKITVVF